MAIHLINQFLLLHINNEFEKKSISNISQFYYITIILKSLLQSRRAIFNDTTVDTQSIPNT